MSGRKSTGDVHIAVVIPTYNERDNIVELINRMHRVMEKHGIRHTFIIVDDNSPDGTADAVRRLAREIPCIKVYVRERKAGLGSAIVYGMRKALEDESVTHVLTLDADLSHRPEDFENFIPFIGKADLIQGSRYIEGGGVRNWGFHRKLISRVANWLVERLYHTGLKEHTTNYRLYSRRAVEDVVRFSRASGYEWIIEALLILHARGYSMVEVPILFINRERGKSKLGVRHIVSWFIYIVGYRKRYKEIAAA